MYLRRFFLSDYINLRESADSYPETPNAFLRVCCVCDNEQPNSSAAVLDIVSGMGKDDRAGFRRGMATILKLANKGTLPSEHFDVNKCHNGHTFTYKGQFNKIKRIRNNDIRVLYFDPGNRILLVTDAFPKHKDKLTNAQKQISESVVKAYLDAKEHIIVNPTRT